MNWTAEDLRLLRCRLGWCRAELARSLGCSHSDIGNWENGSSSPNYDQRQLMIRYFHQVEANSERVQRRPAAESLMEVRGLSQIHDTEVLECLANGALSKYTFIEK